MLPYTHATPFAQTHTPLHTHHVVTVCIRTDKDFRSKLFRFICVALLQFAFVMKTRGKHALRTDGSCACSERVALLRVTFQQALKIDRPRFSQFVAVSRTRFKQVFFLFSLSLSLSSLFFFLSSFRLFSQRSVPHFTSAVSHSSAESEIISLDAGL